MRKDSSGDIRDLSRGSLTNRSSIDCRTTESTYRGMPSRAHYSGIHECKTDACLYEVIHWHCETKSFGNRFSRAVVSRLNLRVALFALLISYIVGNNVSNRLERSALSGANAKPLIPLFETFTDLSVATNV